MENFRFGSQSNNQLWPGKVSSWVCATIPQAGTVTFDCVPEVSLHTGCCSVTNCGFVVFCMDVTLFVVRKWVNYLVFLIVFRLIFTLRTFGIS